MGGVRRPSGLKRQKEQQRLARARAKQEARLARRRAQRDGQLDAPESEDPQEIVQAEGTPETAADDTGTAQAPAEVPTDRPMGKEST